MVTVRTDCFYYMVHLQTRVHFALVISLARNCDCITGQCPVRNGGVPEKLRPGACGRQRAQSGGKPHRSEDHHAVYLRSRTSDLHVTAYFGGISCSRIGRLPDSVGVRTAKFVPLALLQPSYSLPALSLHAECRKNCSFGSSSLGSYPS